MYYCTLQVLVRMLEKDPQKRPNAVELLKDQYISGHLQDLLSEMTHRNNGGTAESDAREIRDALYALACIRNSTFSCA